MWLDTSGDFVNHNPDTYKLIVSEICSAQKMKLSPQQLSSRPAFAVLACSSDKMQEVDAVLTLNFLPRVSARQSWIVTEDSTDNIVKTPRVVRLPATDFVFPLLSLCKPVFFVADTLFEEKMKEPEVDELSAKWARSSSTTHLIASVPQSISHKDSLSIISVFVRRMGIDVQFTKTEDEIQGYKRAKSEIARQK